MSDDTPPWETVAARIEQNRAAYAAEQEAIMQRPYVAGEHWPRFEYIEDEDDAPTALGCSCGAAGTYDEDAWAAHVNELQRRDREAVWKEAVEKIRGHSVWMASAADWLYDNSPYEESP